MTKIINNVGSPFDVETLSGPAVLHAFATLDREFDPDYLEILCAGGYVSIVPDVKDEPDLSALQEEYRDLAGKDADKRWSEKRLADEVEKLMKA